MSTLKTVRIAFVLILAVSLAGCATVQKKFTRKKKEPAHRAASVYFEEGPYQKKYANDYYYKIHFVQWRSWHADMVDDLGGNTKKLSRDGDEAINHLTEMGKYLKPEKQAELQVQIDALQRIVDKLDSGNYSGQSQTAFRSELDGIRRAVSNNFYYDKVKDSLIPDTVDLGPAPTTP